MLVVGRQRQLFAEVLERLVDGEAGADRGDLEQHAARLAEVDRLEVEAVDDRRRVRAALGDAALPLLVLLGRRGPGDVVDGPGAGGAWSYAYQEPRLSPRTSQTESPWGSKLSVSSRNARLGPGSA